MSIYKRLGADAYRDRVSIEAANCLSADAAGEWRSGWWGAQTVEWHIEGIKARNDYLRDAWDRATEKCEPPVESKPTILSKFLRWA